MVKVCGTCSFSGPIQTQRNCRKAYMTLHHTVILYIFYEFLQNFRIFMRNSFTVGCQIWFGAPNLRLAAGAKYSSCATGFRPRANLVKEQAPLVNAKNNSFMYPRYKRVLLKDKKVFF